MSPAASLLCELRTRGVRLIVEAGRLRWTAPAGTMSADLLRRSQAHKPGLMVLLGAEEEKIDRRVKAMTAKGSGRGLPRTIADEPIPTEGDYCETCGEAQAYGRFPRCT